MYGSIDGPRIPDATVPGLVYDVQIYPDTDSSPDDADCYTDAQKAAWRRDEWDYVGVVVKAFVNGYEVGEDSLWGVEHGDYVLTTEDDTVTGTVYIDLDAMINGNGESYEAYPVPDMIEELRSQLAGTIGKTLETLRQALAAIAAEDSPYC